MFRLVAFTLGIMLGATAQAFGQLPTPAPAPQPPPEQTETAAPTPAQSPIPQPTAIPPTPFPPTATPLPSASPAATPTPPSPYKYVVEPTPDPGLSPGVPQIVRIEVNDQTIHPGGQFAVRVTTSPNATRVFATAEGHDIEIPRAQAGLFAGLTTIPGWIPPFFFRTYQVTFTALTQDGKRSTYTIPIALGR